MMFPSLVLGLIVSALYVSSASVPERRAPLATVYSSCKLSKNVALTFDDGPYIHLQDISDRLTAAGAKGTFFFNGNNFDCIYNSAATSRVKYAFNAGHMIGSHTWSHASLTSLSSAQITDGMYRMEEAFSRILGIKPAFMRPPYGDFNDNVRAISFARNQSLAMWDQDTQDADGASVSFSESVYTNAVNQNVNTMLVLNHETLATTADQVLPFAINLLKSHGYKLVTLAECLGVEPYAAIGVPQSGTFSCAGSPGPGGACSGTQCKSGTPPLNGGGGGGGTQTNQLIHPGASSSKCLAAPTNANGASVQIQDCDGSASQSWTRSGSIWQIYSNKCLDVTGGSTANGNKMQIWTCSSGNPNQQFTRFGNTIQWTGRGECLDLTNGVLTNGNVVQMWSCTGGGNQVWNIETGGSTPPPPGKTIRPGASGSICLTAASNANNAAVEIEPCSSGSTAQSWISTGGTLQIFGNKCLDVTSGSTVNGNKMQIYTCNTGNANQQFTITSDHRIQWTGKGKCVDLTDGSLVSGTVVQSWSCTANNPNQVWNFV
jgi:peptidoglycan/xylan/chitin deacetylase (PgdA/CDA1 family)